MSLRGVGLSKSISGRSIVQDLQLELLPGQVLGLLGPNGAGKSTSFKMITGLLEPDRGWVELDHQRLSGPLHQRVLAGLGYLPQRPALLQGVSCLGHILIPLEARPDLSSEQRREEGERLLHEADLSAHREQPAKTLSGGQRRRLELACCLATRPSYLLLDEPFAGVDPVAVRGLALRIRGLAKQGLGVLLTDHAVREAMQVCDQILLLDEGKTLICGTPAEVSADPRARRRWLGEDYEYQGPLED